MKYQWKCVIICKMKNPHIIIGDGKRCLCGMYGDKPIGCNIIISSIEHIESYGHKDLQPDVEILRAIVNSLTEDRPT